MDRLERLTVQLTEAARFLEVGTEPYLRLALELADGSCETQMQAECERRLMWWRVHHGFGAAQPSRSAKREIERDFNKKIAFLESEGILDPAQGRVLRRLHIYRNEAHHRDHLRRNTLESAVRLLIYISADMLNRYRPGMTAMRMADEVPGLRKYIDPESHVPSFGLQQRVATEMRVRSGLDLMTDLATTLSQHSADRFLGVLDSLDCVAEYLGGDADRGTVLMHAMQLAEEDQDEALGVLTKAQRKQLATLSEEDLRRMQSGGEEIAKAATPLEAFHAFADFEDVLEPLETVSGGMAEWVDGYYQHLEDIRRGK